MAESDPATLTMLEEILKGQYAAFIGDLASYSSDSFSSNGSCNSGDDESSVVPLAPRNRDSLASLHPRRKFKRQPQRRTPTEYNNSMPMPVVGEEADK